MHLPDGFLDAKTLLASFGLAAVGSALGVGASGPAAIGAWKKCYAQNRAAPFLLVAYVGAPLTQTIYGMIVMGWIVKAAGQTAANFPALIGAGVFGGIAMGISAWWQGCAAASACDAFAETGKGFTINLIALGIIETVPKPWTPFQWHPMEWEEVLRRRIARIKRLTGHLGGIKVSAESPKAAAVQGVLARGEVPALSLSRPGLDGRLRPGERRFLLQLRRGLQPAGPGAGALCGVGIQDGQAVEGPGRCAAVHLCRRY